MSKKVDERVVEMRFDNKDFESNVQKSMSTLDRLKKALKLDGVSKGLENVSGAAKKVDLSGISNGIDTVNARFSSMQVVAMTALSNITTAAMSAGKNLISALTIDPIISGFQEYETQIGAIQTILANTQSKGSTLQDVNMALDELNKYADQTIYNFTEMTKNIGTFTAAGVDLDKSVTSIKGIANLAAVSGSTSVQASTAMYQLSQALAAGRVSLMDWNSVVNAGMGGELFQNALKRTAENMGTNVDALIEKYGSFRESLTEGQWLTADVLTETLTQLSGAYTEADLISQGYTEAQAKEITQLAETAVNAATKVKTFTALFDTLGEALQSGWTTSWEIILGDFNEAQDMFTKISESLGGAINASADARNNVLMGGLASGWKQFLDKGIKDEQGFIGSIKEVANQHGIAVDKMMEDGDTFESTLKDGWLTSDMLTESVTKYVDGLTKMSAEQRNAAGYTAEEVEALKQFAEQLKTNSSLAEEFTNKMRMASGRENIIQGLWNAFEGLASILTTVKDAFTDIFPPMTGDQLYDLTVKFKEFTETLKPSTETLGQIKRIASGVFSGLSLIGKGISTLLSPIGKLMGSDGFGGFMNMLLEFAADIGDFFTTLNKSAGTGDFFGGIASGLGSFADLISNVLTGATDSIQNFGDAFTFVANGISKIAGTIGNVIKDAFSWLSENVTFDDIFAGVGAAGIFTAAQKLGGVFDMIKEKIEGIFGGGDDSSSLKDKFVEFMDGIHGALESFTVGIKASTLVAIAAAIGILSASLKSISEIDAGNVVKSLLAMGTMFTMLNLSFNSITKSLDKFQSKGVVKAGVALIAMAAALKIFAGAMEEIADLDLDEIGKSLLGLGGGLAELVAALKFLDGVKVSLTTSVAILALAQACSMLADAVSEFSGMSWEEIARGLTGMGGALAELVAALGILSKVGGGGALLGSVGILIAVQALDEISDNLKKLGSLSWEEIGRGLAAMGGALAEVGIVTGALGKLAGFSGILGSGAILIAVQSLDEISEDLKKLGSLSWEEIGKGLAAMGGALLEIGVVTGALGTRAGFSGILGAGTILLAVQSLEPIATTLKRLGEMSWEEIGRGLAAMGGALAELGAASALTGLAGFSGLVGAGSILLAVQGLDQLASGLQKFGEMSWDEIGRGLTAMGAALVEIGGASFLTGLGGLASIAGAGTLTLAVQGLDQLATALQKFGEMSWDEIGRGLTAMGAALGETALGGLLNTFSGFGAGAIAEMAEPLGLLADSVKKWSGVTVPDGLGEQLGILADGVGKFTFSGLGAGAISSAAEPLGVLADSVRKWTSVTVPEGLSEQLGQLAEGVGKFTFSGIGAGGLAAAAGPLGTMADSVQKWAGVTVPEGMQEKLEGLAKGVEAFSFAFMGGWSIGAIVEPLGSLAGSVSKWNGVTIPEGIQTGLEGLAKGVEAWTWAFVGGWSIGAVVEPLSNLAGAVRKWNGVTIPEGVQSKLEGLAKGVKAMGEVKVGNLTSVCTAIGDIGGAVQKVASVDFASVSSGLQSFATSISNIQISSNNFANLGNQIVDGFINSINAGIGRVQSAMTSLANSVITSFSVAVIAASGQMTAAGANLMNGLANGMRSGTDTVRSAAQAILISVASLIGEAAKTFTTGGLAISQNLATGITQGGSLVLAAAMGVSVNAAAGARAGYGAFYSAGVYLCQGLANGISANSYIVRARASAMAASAASAARRALDINSPSKVFEKIGRYVPEGFAKGISSLGTSVSEASKLMANDAIETTRRVIERMGNLIDGNIDINPVITPVVDLDNVADGVASINSLMSNTVPVNLSANIGSINRLMNQRDQNGEFGEVVSAINQLDRSIQSLERPTYNVGGITYDDGSAIAGAVGDLIRAARIERRS